MAENQKAFEESLPFELDKPSAQDRIDKENYRKRLAACLKDPEFRTIEGFPIGSDEAILDLSDPPFYTACPNPFLPEILEQWQQERQALRQELGLPDDSGISKGEQVYKREPFAADVSEGKNDPIYNAHSYHTKVPHKAIMRYILHYTDPGDIVFDGFCGTGMTGVAAQLCGDKKTVESLGYRVDQKGLIYEGDKLISRLGARKAVLNDLSPAASFIAYNYNTPVDAHTFEREARQVLADVDRECGWMYETWHPHCDNPHRVKGKINYTVWSDVFSCPNCGKEMVFWDVAVDQKKNAIKREWNCPGCASLFSKSPSKDSGALKVERVMDKLFDRALNETITQARQVPVLINYSLGKKRYEKQPDEADLALIRKIDENDFPYSFPIDRMPEGSESRRNDDIGLTHVHHFYTKRNLRVISAYLKLLDSYYLSNRYRNKFLWGATGISDGSSKLNRERITGLPSKLSGTLYVGSTIREINTINFLDRKLRKLTKLKSGKNQQSEPLILTQSSSAISLSIDSIDYMFIDPPFGNNLMYSELNALWEGWLRIFTNNNPEAIVNKFQQKGLIEYQTIMQICFDHFFAYLKPGRWMTVEFHNSQNSVWNAIQEAIQQAGFVIADVRTLDKQQATFKQVTTNAAVKQDLIISAYKPKESFERHFEIQGGSIQGAWEFVRQHLEQLPMPGIIDGIVEMQAERTPYLLYDRMLAFHLTRGLTIPLNSSEFYRGLSDRFLMRDGMAFTNTQANAYDNQRLLAEKVEQLSLFVSDENSTRQWLRLELDNETGNGPQTYSELQPKFLKQLHQSRYEQLPELLEILKEGFLQDEQDRWYVPNLDKQADLEALRTASLLREFNQITQGKNRIRAFRSEAVKAGFSKAWREHKYNLIVQVADRFPEQALQEDPQLKMYVDNARGRARLEPKQERLF